MGLLEQYYDHELELSDTWTEATFGAMQLGRLEQELRVVTVGMTLQGRLAGVAAPREERALDRRRWRRLAHALSTAFNQWRSATREHKRQRLEPDEASRVVAAQRDWTDWQQEYIATLNGHMVRVATYAVREGKREWGNRALYRLRSELDAVDYAMRSD